MGGFATEISFDVSRDWLSLQTPQFQTLKYWKLYERKIGCYKSQEASVTTYTTTDGGEFRNPINSSLTTTQALLVSTTPTLSFL